MERYYASNWSGQTMKVIDMMSKQENDYKIMLPVLKRFGNKLKISSYDCDFCRSLSNEALIHKEIRGYRFHFCSEECVKKFEKEVTALIL